GDPGSSRFFLSLEDDLLRIFGSGRISGIMDKLGMEEDEPIEHNLISRAIENAQKKVEGHNFDIRKHLLEYDDVMNKQREVIYRQRREVLSGDDLKNVVQDMVDDQIEVPVSVFANSRLASEDWDWDGFEEQMLDLFQITPNWSDEDKSGMDENSFREKITGMVEAHYKTQEDYNGEDTQRHLERVILLQMVDTHWKDHLLSMDHLKQSIGLRGYGQKKPLDEYKKEGFSQFLRMIDNVKQQTVSTLMRVRVVQEDDVDRLEAERRERLEQERAQATLNKGAAGEDAAVAKPTRREGEKVGRNAPCPCGSGKKFKKCCGKPK
ncbi:MAG TPA: preprotein translocase subunit SecA, partial [Desulfobacterales bacterium]|nr:preprotein translocase subunit SecA [Desulfobacterales bacterium]